MLPVMFPSDYGAMRESPPNWSFHTAHPEGEAKFWLTPSVHLAKNVGLSGVQLRQAQAVVEAHIQEIQDAWNRHFWG